MRTITLLPLAFVLAACGSEETCNPFLESMDCVQGETPEPARRHGLTGREGRETVISLQAGPSAGSTNGPGPSPGSTNGPGPGGLGSTSGHGTFSGSTSGSGPSPGSTNSPDLLMPNESPRACGDFCAGVYTPCAIAYDSIDDRFVDPGPAGFTSITDLIEECTRWCECLRSVAPVYTEAFLRAFGPCSEKATCFQVAECVANVDESVDPSPARPVFDHGGLERCGNGPSL